MDHTPSTRGTAPVTRLRVASVQYALRPITTFDAFAEQVEAHVATAADRRCGLLVFPEYFSLQLLSLPEIRGDRPLRDRVREVACHEPAILALMRGLATEYAIHIAAGTIPSLGDGGALHNDAHLFAPDGRSGRQGKLHMTRFESEELEATARDRLVVFDTEIGRLAIAICYDVEFPELVRAAARAGARLILVPSFTDDRSGFLRVRHCAHARAVENQLYVVQASTVGALPRIPAMHLTYGQAAILTPSDFGFARDGILAEGDANQEAMVIGDLDMAALDQVRHSGTVLPLNDSVRTAALVRDVELRTL